MNEIIILYLLEFYGFFVCMYEFYVCSDVSYFFVYTIMQSLKSSTVTPQAADCSQRPTTPGVPHTESYRGRGARVKRNTLDMSPWSSIYS